MKPALIQNGNSPSAYTESGAALVERAGDNAVKPALIQNGNSPSAYTESGA